MRWRDGVTAAVCSVALMGGMSFAQWDVSGVHGDVKTFSDPAERYALRIPSSWQVNVKNGSTVFQWDKSTVTFMATPGESTPMAALRRAETAVRSIGQNYQGGEPSVIALSSAGGDTLVFRVTGPDGVPSRGRIYAAAKGDDGLAFILVSPEDDYEVSDLAFRNALATLDVRAQAPRSATLDEGTPVRLLLKNTLKSGREKKGSAVGYTVAADVLAPDGSVLIAKGAEGLGVVLRSQGRRMFGKPGKIDISIESVVAADGSRVPLRANAKISERGRNNAGAVTVTALLLTPLALFVNGRDVDINAGTEIVGYVDSKCEIKAPSAKPARTGGQM